MGDFTFLGAEFFRLGCLVAATLLVFFYPVRGVLTALTVALVIGDLESVGDQIELRLKLNNRFVMTISPNPLPLHAAKFFLLIILFWPFFRFVVNPSDGPPPVARKRPDPESVGADRLAA